MTENDQETPLCALFQDYLNLRWQFGAIDWYHNCPHRNKEGGLCRKPDIDNVRAHALVVPSAHNENTVVFAYQFFNPFNSIRNLSRLLFVRILSSIFSL